MQENVKQIIVKMTARRAFRTEPIWQYDVGHELVFEGFELPAAFEVHFSLSPMGKSITQVGQNGVCVLPDMYAQTAAPIYAWLYIVDTETGLTKYSIEIPVQRRAKPTNQQPTPVEQSAIDQAIAALNAGVEAAEDAQEAAEAAQASAESYAESAGQSAITATNAATSAAASAGNAAASATSAGTSATDANASREAADQSATNAGVSERAAAGSASAAAQSAIEASNTVSGAVATINTAKDSAVAAVQTKGDEVLESIPADYSALTEEVDEIRSDLTELEPKVDSLEISKADVIISSASGAIASFSDGADGLPVKSLSVAIEPVQDLHGYDHPWPAGGGKNLAYLEQGSLYFDTTGAEKPSSDRLRTNYIPIQKATKYIASFTGDSLTVKNGCKYDANKQYLGYGSFPIREGEFILNDDNTKYVRFIYGKADNTDITPDGYKYQFELGSTATAWTPYSNICPISGLDAVKVTRTGKNLLNLTAAFRNRSSYTFNNDGSVTVNGSDGNAWAAVQSFPLKKGTYTFSRSEATGYSDIRIGYENYATSHVIDAGKKTYTFTLTEDTSIKIKVGYSALSYPFTVFCQIESGSANTDFAKYSGQTYDIIFPSEAGTVYGGELTVNEDGTGTLVVDRVMLSLNTDDLNSSSDYPGWNDVAGLREIVGAGLNNIISGAITDFTSAYVRVNTHGAGNLFFTKAQLGMTADELRQAMPSMALHIVLPLATPQTYTLTASQVTTLLGTNNVWADAGDTTVQYRADTKLYIDNKITQAIAAALNA